MHSARQVPDGAPQQRDGRRVAQLFRRIRLTSNMRDVRRCDLDAILEEDGLEVCESEVSECGYVACLIRAPEGGGGIMIAPGQEQGRRRFSLAHELGHFHIPSHRRVGLLLPDEGQAFSCADADLRARSTDARQREWEANDFAAELLMPYALYANDVESRDATIRAAMALAQPDMYDVSLTAAAWRLIETTREACALVVCVNGQVEWVVRSRAWTHPLAERHRPVPAGSMAAAVVSGEVAVAGGEQVNPAVWLAGSDGRSSVPFGIKLIESTHSIPRLRQTLSLLWSVNEDE